MRNNGKPENKERVLDMARMRLDGYTMQKIAEKYNVSKQYVQQELSIFSGGGRTYRMSYEETIVFPNIAKWLKDNDMSVNALAKSIGLPNGSVLYKKLRGEMEIGMREIKKLLEATGQTFEYMFAEKAVEDESE